MFNRFFFRGITICILIGGTATFTSAQEYSTPWPVDGKDICAPYCSPCPSSYAYGEFLFLRRGNSSIRQDIVQSQPVPVDGPLTQTFFSTSDLSFQFEPAFRAVVGHGLHDGWAWEAAYLGLFDATAYEACIFPTDPNTMLSFPDPPGGLNFNVFADIDRMWIRYSSAIHSGELNLVHCLGGCVCPCKGDYDSKHVHFDNTWCRTYEWLFGLRYLSVREQLQIYGERDLEITGGGNGPIFGTEDGFYNISTRNNLLGPQIGARMRHWNDRLGWELSGKLGAFYNDAAQQQLVVDFPDFELRSTTGASGSQFAYMSEVNLTGLFRLTRVWNLRAGYNLIYIGGLALAPDQLDFSSGAASGQGLNRSGGILLHGVNLGLEARW